MKKTILVLFLGVWQVFAYGQLQKRVLPRNINIPGKQQMAPSISGDGKSMLFLTDYTKSGNLELRYVQMRSPGEWSDPEEIPVININGQHHFPLGFNLSYDGKTIFFTSRMSHGIGNYDIWYTTKQNGKWSQPKNLGKPVNSKSHDLGPSLSPDGRYLYYMRCDRVEGRKAERCRLMVAERRNAEYWNDPVALPEVINSGQAAFPTILADGRSLIYTTSSNWAPGSHPFFITRKENGQWSPPQEVKDLSEENTIPFISNSMQGDIIYMSVLRRDLDVCMAKLPESSQPSDILLLQGKVTDKLSGQPLDAYLQVYDRNNGKLFNFTRSDEQGNFFMPLPADIPYNIAVNVAQNDYTYYSGNIEDDSLTSFSVRDLAIQLEELQPGASMVLSDIYFGESGMLDEESLPELRRLFKLLRDNANLKVEIGGYFKKLPMDSSSYDTLSTVIKVDTLFSATQSESLPVDSLSYPPDAQGENSEVLPKAKTDPAMEMARAVVDFLVSKGIAPERIMAKGYSDARGDSGDPSQYPDQWLELKVTGYR